MELVVLLFFSVGFWLLLVRPQQQRLRAQRDLIASLEVGDRVVTAGGLIGNIIRLDERDAEIEVAPGVILTFLRPAVSRRLDADADADADEGLGVDDDLGVGEAGAGAAAIDMGTTEATGTASEQPAADTGAGPTSAPGGSPTGAPGAGTSFGSTGATGTGATGPTSTGPTTGDDDIEEGTH